MVMEWLKPLKNLHCSDTMIYELAEKAKRAVENNCDAYEIYIDKTRLI